MKKFNKCLLCIISILIMGACQKPSEINEDITSNAARQSVDEDQKYVDLSVKADYEVRDGMLFFRNAEKFVALDKILRKLNPEGRVAFTTKLGFKSLLDIELSVYKTLSEAESKDRFSSILASNVDILKVTENGNRITSIFEDVSAALLNREGMVSIGGRVHCFVKGKTIVSSSADDVRASYKAGKKLKESTIIYEDANASKGRLAYSPCSSMFQAAQNSDGNRRVEIRVDIFRRLLNIANNHCDVEFYLYARGDPFKKNFWGNWTYYSTGNTLTPRFGAWLKVWNPMYQSPAYFIYTKTVDEPSRSNDGTFIDYSYTMAYYSGAVYSNTLNGDGYTYEVSLSDSSPAGTYTSGGVPNGVEMKCP